MGKKQCEMGDARFGQSFRRALIVGTEIILANRSWKRYRFDVQVSAVVWLSSSRWSNTRMISFNVWCVFRQSRATKMNLGACFT
ncbi:protein of unknown function (plasmid) [Caballeronia sp. S22]